MTTNRHSTAKQIPLKCSACGETWVGSASMIGKSCINNPLVGSPDVVQCDPEELDRIIDWDAEGGF